MKRKNKILLVANSTWNFYNFRMNIIDALIDREDEVVLVSPVDEFLAPLLEVKQVRHIPLKNLYRKGVNPVQEVKLYNELKEIYRNELPELIIHFTIKPNIYGNLAAKSLDIKSICVVTGLGYVFLHDTFYNSFAKRMYQYSFKKADLIIFENEDDRNLFIEKNISTAEKSLSVKGCGVNLDYYKPLPSLENKGTKIIFSFIARLMYDKGIVEFIEAAKIVKKQNQNAEFWVAGEIDSGNPSSIKIETLHEWIEDGTIKYFGHVRDVRPIIAKSDCIVLPSYREAMARTLTEALSMEKPIISCDTSGCRAIVDDGINGYLVPVKNVGALAEAMEKYQLLSEGQRKRMGQKGRQKAQDEFDDHIVTRQYLGILNQLKFNVE
ncbi:MAG TPA: glycosyltransferase family 4 protein [Saprospiraceae bacterium]|nr:glycosyltransferase family 4 protein [Saprospiraceae bacterium]